MNARATTLLLLIVLLSACSSEAAVTPIPYIETNVDPETWALVPAGEFFQGQQDEIVTLDYDYEIMITDVTNAQYARYLNEALAAGWISLAEGAGGREVSGPYPGDVFRGFKHEEEIAAGDYLHVPVEALALRLSFDGQGFRAVPGYENHPMVMVSWFGARAYCEYYSWRLPSDAEWEKAARGSDNRPYPWGAELARNNANYYSSHDVFERLAGGLGDTTPVGFYNGGSYDGYTSLDSPSPYGLYDMAGNVWQWTADIHENTHYRTMRGGSHADYGYNLRIWTRNSAGPEYASPNVGFRCARTP